MFKTLSPLAAVVLTFSLSLPLAFANPNQPPETDPRSDAGQDVVHGPDGPVSGERPLPGYDSPGQSDGLPEGHEDDGRNNDQLFYSPGTETFMDGRNETFADTGGLANMATGPNGPRNDLEPEEGYVNGPDGPIYDEDRERPTGGMIDDPVGGYDDGRNNDEVFSEALSVRENLAQHWNAMTADEREAWLNTTAAALATTGLAAGTYYASPYLKNLMSQRVAVASGRVTAATLLRGAGRAVASFAGILLGLEVFFDASPANAKETLEYWLTEEGVSEWLNSESKAAEFYLQLNPEYATFIVELNQQAY